MARVRVLRHAAAALMIVPLWHGTACAQDDPLVTDRPDFTESSEVVGRGLFQFESGLTIDGDGAARGLTVPSALVRIGVTRRLELRVGGDGFLSQSDGLARQSGYSDLELGIKVKVLDQARAGLDMSLIPMASLPTGGEAFSSGGTDPTLKLTFARTAPFGFDLSGNANISSVSDEWGRFTQRALSLSAGHDLMGGWGTYVEAYGFAPMTRGDQAGITVNGGFSHPVGHTAQFDVEVGRGVTPAADDWFVGAGFAVRGRMPRWR